MNLTRFTNCAVYVLLVLPLISTAAFAQRGESSSGGVIGMVRLLQDEAVQNELGLSEKQLTAVQKVVQLLAQVRDGKAQSQAQSTLSASLSGEQYKRLKQLHWQRMGGYAILEPEVSKTLEISEEQRKQLAAAQTKNRAEHQKMRDFMSRARFRSAEAVEQYKSKFRTAANQRLRAILTPSQIKELDRLLGKQLEK